MRPCLLLLVIILQFASISAQRIDSLRTEDQVVAFINSVFKEEGTKIIAHSSLQLRSPLNPQQRRNEITRFGSVAYELADFDNNGYTDLLFNGFYESSFSSGSCNWITMVVLSFGNDSVVVRKLTNRTFTDFFVAKVIRIDGHAYIKTLDIEGEHSTFGGLGLEGGYVLIIWDDSVRLDKEQSASLKPSTAIDTGGVFLARLDTATCSKLYGLLKYIDIPHLKQRYHVRWTDDITGYLGIYYNGGRFKKVEDYGQIGTYGLSALEELLNELLTSQYWSRIGPSKIYL